MSIQPNPALDWPIAWAAVEEIARSEGCRLKAYRCPAGQWTIGWGHTDGVRPGDTLTQEQADQTLCIDLKLFTEAVRSMMTREPSDNELGAMVSLAYNIGREGFRKSTVLRKHNEGDTQSAARAFGLWNKSKGQALAGLTARRARESALYLTPDVNDALPMPQQVDGETSLKVSPIAVSGGVSIVGGLGAVLSQLPDVISQGQAVSVAIGANPVIGVGLAVIYAGYKALMSRVKQRSEGWA